MDAASQIISPAKIDIVSSEIEKAFMDMKQVPFDLKPITIIVGHYGVGKTNLALNIAQDTACLGKQVTLIDLDIVNPYFRSSDYSEQLETVDVNVIGPVYAGTSLDVPSLSGAIYPVLQSADEDHLVIVDVGGDDAGATSLGRFNEAIKEQNYAMLYVVNAYRNLTQTAEEAVKLMVDIEARSGLRVSGIVNNSHLKDETSIALIEKSYRFAEKVAKLADLPLVATTVPVTILSPEGNGAVGSESSKPKSSALLASLTPQKPYVVQVYVRTPWEQ